MRRRPARATIGFVIERREVVIVNYSENRRLIGPVAVGAVVLALALNALGVYGDGGEHHASRDFLVVAALIAAVAVAVFGFVVPRGLTKEAAAATALVLSILGLVLVPVFWSGLPPILAAGGVLLGWAGRDATRGRTMCRVAIAVGCVALLADVAVYVGDFIATNV
jgi:drug/metabolite transporter (DMT)-like permease